MHKISEMFSNRREALLGGVGGLLTGPEKAQSTRELAWAAQRLAASPDGGEVPETAADEIRKLMDSLTVESPDTMPNAFTDRLMTAHGHALVRCGFEDDSVRDAEFLLSAVSMVELAQGEVERLMISALALMRAVADRSGWQPYDAAGDEFGAVETPDDETLAARAWRVTFTPAELDRICGVSWAGHLNRLLLLNRPTADDRDLDLRPLVPSSGGGLIVARPDALAPALAAAAAAAVVDAGGGRTLDELFRGMSIRRALVSLSRMSLHRVRPVPEVEADFDRGGALLLLDLDAVLHMTVLTPDLTDGVPGSFNMWIPPEQDALVAYLDAVGEQVGTETPFLRTVIHLVVLEGAGAQPIMVLDRPRTVKAPHIVLTGSELEWASRHPEFSRRDLDAFAYDAVQLEERSSAFFVSDFDKLSAWREDPLAFVRVEAAAREVGGSLVLSAGNGRDLRMDVLRRFAPTVASAPDGESEWPIARHLEYEDVDIWAVWDDPESPGHLFVPGYGPGVWVLDGLEPDEAQRNTRRTWIELVAYWLWRLRLQLPQLRAACKRRVAPLCVVMRIDFLEGLRDEDGDTDANGAPYEIRIQDGAVHIDIYPWADAAFGPTDDRGETQFVESFLAALAEAAGASVDAVVVPTGLRKLVFMSMADPAAAPTPAPDPTVHDSFRLRAYRRAGTAVRLSVEEHGDEWLAGAPNEALHIAVDSLFKAFEERVASLDAQAARFIAVAFYERALHDQLTANIELSLIEVHFGQHEREKAERFERQLELQQASVAIRFLIEYIAANPPAGDAPPSDAVVQELLADAMAIIHLGHVSDAIKFGLAIDVRVWLEGTDWLRALSMDMLSAQSQYATATYRSDIDRSAALRSVEPLDTGTSELSDLYGLLDEAHVADHGFALRDLFEALAHISHSIESPGSVVTVTRDELVSQLTSIGGGERLARSVIEALSLTPRDKFLRPSPPFTANDVYPWRYNRGLSYNRRPLVAVRDAEGGLSYTFGRGAAYAAAMWLERLARTGRLGAEGSEVRKASEKVQNHMSRAFEEQVARAFEEIPGWKCLRRVRKLGSVRLEHRPGQEVGDVDVLAAHEDLRVVLCVEAKALAGALAPHQLRNELNSTFAAHTRPKSAAVKLLQRRDVVADELPRALRALDISAPSSGWRIAAFIITDYEVLSHLLEDCPVPVFSIEETRRLLRQHAFVDQLSDFVVRA